MWLGLNRIFALWSWPPGTWAPDAFSLLNLQGFFDGILPLTGSYWWCQAQEVLTVTTSYHNCRLFDRFSRLELQVFCLSWECLLQLAPFNGTQPGPVVNIPNGFFRRSTCFNHPKSVRRISISHRFWFQCHHSWLVVWNIFYFPIYWECHHPNWLIFFRGVAQPPTRFPWRKWSHFLAAPASAPSGGSIVMGKPSFPYWTFKTGVPQTIGKP